MEYLQIYLAGSATVIVLGIIKFFYFKTILWIFKIDIINKNLAKISLEPKLSFWEKVGAFFIALIFESLLSWINVLVILWQFIYQTIKILRDVFLTVPEDIKSLRFPLKNNPDLDAETVWAYTQALSFKNGNTFSSDELGNSLIELRNGIKYFQPIKATLLLRSLGTHSNDLIDEIDEKLRDNRL